MAISGCGASVYKAQEAEDPKASLYISPIIEHFAWKIVCKNEHICRLLSRLFEVNALPFPIVCSKIPKVHWIRDSTVLRPDGMFLLPRSADEPVEVLDKRFLCVLPSFLHRKTIANAELSGIVEHVGGGMMEENVSALAALLTECKKSYISGCSTIEGGNCLISRSRRVAVIGENSIWLSLLQSKELQDAWDREKSVRASVEGAAGEASTRADAFPLCVLSAIKRELGVDTLAAVVQRDFHIDMEMFLSSDGKTIFISSTPCVVDLLEAEIASSSDPVKRDFLSKYLEVASSQMKIHASIECENLDKLVKQGFGVVLIPAELHVPDKFISESDKRVYPRVNFNNGLFLPDGSWVTADIPSPQFDFLKKAFEKFLQPHLGSKAKIHFIGGGYFPEMMRRYSGGLRCSTIEMIEDL